MKASELRIGNWYKSEKGEEFIVTHRAGQIRATVDSIEIPLTWGYFCDVAEGVLLTEEWLQKFGLVEGVINTWYTFVNRNTQRFEAKQLLFEKGSWNVQLSENFLTRIEYVHQLQNLYFALTNSELKIKETS